MFWKVGNVKPGCKTVWVLGRTFPGLCMATVTGLHLVEGGGGPCTTPVSFLIRTLLEIDTHPHTCIWLCLLWSLPKSSCLPVTLRVGTTWITNEETLSIQPITLSLFQVLSLKPNCLNLISYVQKALQCSSSQSFKEFGALALPPEALIKHYLLFMLQLA